MYTVSRANSSAKRARITVVPIGEGHHTALAEFFRVAWGGDASADTVAFARGETARANPVDRGSPPPAYVAVQEERIIGYCGSIPVRFWDGRSERGSYWAKGLMVLPEFRNGPIGFLVLQELSRSLAVSAAVTVHLASKRLFKALGYADKGALMNYVRPVAAGRMLQRIPVELGGLPAWVQRVLRLAQRSGLAFLVGASGGVGLRLMSVVGGMGGGFDIELDAAPSSADLDRLWLSLRRTILAGVVRDATALLPRYGDGAAGANYRYAAVRSGSELVGLAIVRRPRAQGDPRLRGIRVATVSELIFPADRGAIGAAALLGAERVARSMGADAILCTACHPAAISALRRQLYLPIAGNVHFFLQDKTASASWPQALSDWWLTRGDGESDATF